MGECLARGDGKAHGTWHFPDRRQVEGLLEHGVVRIGLDALGTCRLECDEKVAGRIVGRLVLELVTCDEGCEEHRHANDVIDQLGHVPLLARRALVQLAGVNLGKHLAGRPHGTYEVLMSFTHGCPFEFRSQCISGRLGVNLDRPGEFRVDLPLRTYFDKAGHGTPSHVSGIRNKSISDALVGLLGKPIAESSALFIPTAIYPFPGGGERAYQALTGASKSKLCDLGWKSLGLLESTALPSIQRESWVPTLQETDALLVWGGNVLYLCHWMRQSGLADLLPSLERVVYVGVSAGSIVTTPYNCDVESNLEFVPPNSDMGIGADRALGLVDFTMWVHVDNPDPMFEEHSMANVERWAAGVPVPTYAIDDETAIKVSGGNVEVVSEGHWNVFNPTTANG